LRIRNSVSSLFACSIFFVCLSFGQTPAEEPQSSQNAVQANAGAAEDNGTSEDPQGHDKAAGSGTAARTKPSPAGTASASTTYVFPTTREMNRFWFRNTIGPEALIGGSFTASWNQWVSDSPREWTKDGEGWGKRFGAAMLDNGINESSLVLISRAIGQDPRYHRCDCTGLWPRSRQAVKLAFMSYNRNGNIVFSPAKIIAPFTGPMVTRNTIYPDRYGFGDAASSGGYYFAGRVAWNLFREFIWKKSWL
jgi:hypothetical protein